jgi:hypothetical protein
MVALAHLYPRSLLYWMGLWPSVLCHLPVHTCRKGLASTYSWPLYRHKGFRPGQRDSKRYARLPDPAAANPTGVAPSHGRFPEDSGLRIIGIGLNVRNNAENRPEVVKEADFAQRLRCQHGPRSVHIAGKL